jgi:hypothetical protein
MKIRKVTKRDMLEFQKAVDDMTSKSCCNRGDCPSADSDQPCPLDCPANVPGAIIRLIEKSIH